MRSSKMTLSVLALVGGMLLTTGAARAQTTYYVATCGDDTWSGLSAICAAPDGPKASIGSAIALAVDGDEVEVA